MLEGYIVVKLGLKSNKHKRLQTEEEDKPKKLRNPVEYKSQSTIVSRDSKLYKQQPFKMLGVYGRTNILSFNSGTQLPSHVTTNNT